MTYDNFGTGIRFGVGIYLSYLMRFWFVCYKSVSDILKNIPATFYRLCINPLIMPVVCCE